MPLTVLMGKLLAQAAEDPPVPGADLLVGRQKESDSIAVRQGFVNDIIKPLSQDCPRPMYPGGIDQDDLAGSCGDDSTDSFTCGFRL